MSDETPVRLGTWPTPLEPAPRLARLIGLEPDDLWIKRDDLTGLAGGGNKVRKLEWTAGAALRQGARTLVTSGAPQSNHARLTAAAAARLGMDAVLVLKGSPPVAVSGNIALDGILGARIVWAGDVDQAGLDAVLNEVAEELRAQGAEPAVIPFGGSSVLAARGYAEAGHELLAQAPGLATVVVAMGSGGTMAGLVHALGADRVLGVDVGAVTDPVQVVSDFVAGLAGPGARAPHALRLRRDQIGAGYADLTDAVTDALTTTARAEGVVLDPVYTGRAMAGLIAAVAEGDVRPGQRTVFLHTGGMPGLFGHASAMAWAQGAVTGSSTVRSRP
ncbi:D-cysteine desulfhydrase family protein [Streptomyces sp. NBC_01317]|uniref:D-cysteine desulfhydrase family protein n=1 Tax=Streptomyces sp. NBC_01317 TaxID=2903822 RepID=UPI002E11C930|nr:D-cysteine desulfhydrase family protein [Streptomyces sp. NBC_01317]